MAGRNPLIVVLGATGTGKTKLAVELCQRFGGEIFNTDSMQIYKGLDISTNKATDEEMQGVRQHMIAFLEPNVTGFNVIQFRDMILSKIRHCWSENKLPVIVGGTSYYIEAVLWNQLIKQEGATSLQAQPFSQWYTEGLAPDVLSLSNGELHERLRQVDRESAGLLHPNERRRVLNALQTYYRDGLPRSQFIKLQKQQAGANPLGGSLRLSHVLLFYVNTTDWPALVRRLDGRVDDMVARGLEAELTQFYDQHHQAHISQLQQVKETAPDIDESVLESEYTKGVFQSIGLKEFKEFLALTPEDRQTAEGRRRFDKGVELLKIATRQYARRQQRFVRNRLLKHPERNLPAMYELDTTDASLWQSQVSQPSQAIVDCFLNDQPVPSDLEQRHRCRVEDEASSENHRTAFRQKPIRCSYCDVIVSNEHSWQAHITGKHHRYVRGKYLRAHDLTGDHDDQHGRQLLVPDAQWTAS